MGQVQVGIVGTGIYLPQGRMSAREISDLTKGVWSEQAVIDKLGIQKKRYLVNSLKTALKKWVL